MYVPMSRTFIYYFNNIRQNVITIHTTVHAKERKSKHEEEYSNMYIQSDSK